MSDDDGSTRSETIPDDRARMAERIRELERENARLSAARPRHPGRWRAVLSALCIVVATVLVPVSLVAAWSRAQLVDEARFVATLAPLAHDPAVQQMIVDETMSAIDERVDYTQITGNVIEGITSLGVPPRAADALMLLQKPAADGLRSLVRDGVTGVVESDAFANVWSTAVTGAHRAIAATAASDGSGVVVMTADGLGLRLGPIIEQVKQRLVDRGVGVASLIPTVDRTIIIGDGQAVSTIRVVYATAVTLGWWLPVLTLALLIAGILLARRRTTAVVGSGVALVVGGGITVAALSFGAVAVGVAADQLGVSPPALDVVYHALVDDMSRTGTILIVLGIVVAVSGWTLGSSRPARRFRGFVSTANRSARNALDRRGLDTGGFGRFLAGYRIAVRVVIVALAVVWLALLRPLSFGDIVLVALTGIVVAWVLELLQRRDDERTEAEGALDSSA